MEELKNVVQEYTVEIQSLDRGFKLTRVAHPEGFGSDMNGACHYKDFAFMTAGHPPRYFLMNQHGEIEGVFRENAGLLPQFFMSPQGEPWVCLSVYYPDKERENVFPLFHRQDYEPPKPKRDGTLGSYIGCIADQLYFVYGTEKIQQIPWIKKNVPGKTSIIKIPKEYKWAGAHIFNNALHLLNIQSDENLDLGDYLNGIKPTEEMPIQLQMQHALLSAEGQLVQQREFEILGVCDTVFIHHLSFTETSTFLTLDMLGNIRWFEVDVNGQVKGALLHCIHEDFFCITAAQRLTADTFLLTFTTGKGNGWLVVRAGQLLACYVGNDCVYKDEISGHEIKIPFQNKSVIAGSGKTVDNGYCLAFYELQESSIIKMPAIYFLNKVV